MEESTSLRLRAQHQRMLDGMKVRRHPFRETTKLRAAPRRPHTYTYASPLWGISIGQVADLKAVLRQCGMKITGVKKDLKDRIENMLDQCAR